MWNGKREQALTVQYRKPSVSEYADFFSTPAGRVIGTLSTRWGVPTVEAIHDGHTHFNQLQRNLSGISHKVLIDTLRSLQRDGFVHGPLTGPGATEYLLTDLGIDLVDFIADIRDWSEERSPELVRARDEFDRNWVPKGQRATWRRPGPFGPSAGNGLEQGRRASHS